MIWHFSIKDMIMILVIIKFGTAYNDIRKKTMSSEDIRLKTTR